VRGLVLLGYPLHPPGKPSERRDAHLPGLRRPALIIQGSRDAFGTPAEFEDVLGRMSPRPTLHVVERGDHSFKVVPGGKKIQAEVHARLQDTIVSWIQGVLRGRDTIA
jgi:predicted alpha/beta-hydrolase family hydrolase